MEISQMKKRKETKPAFAIEAAPITTSPKKRKSTSEERTSFSSNAPAAMERCFSLNSDESPSPSPASCCSSNESFIKLSNPEVESVQAETSTCDCVDQTISRRKMSSSSELRTNSPEVESVEKKKQTMPSESELEEFFSAAEKDIQKQFQYKYNYDIVKDVPLEGRYEWVQIKP